jgi:hypothetical protein
MIFRKKREILIPGEERANPRGHPTSLEQQINLNCQTQMLLLSQISEKKGIHDQFSKGKVTGREHIIANFHFKAV